MDGQELWRDRWPVLDRTLAVEPAREKLLTGVKSVTFRFMDGSRSWLDRWPETQTADQAEGRLRPAAVEVTIELEDWGTIRRLVEVPG
jgi:type II secretion system protein J